MHNVRILCLGRCGRIPPCHCQRQLPDKYLACFLALDAWQSTLDGLQIESAVGLPLSGSYVLMFHHSFKPTVCKAAVGNKRALKVSAVYGQVFVLLRCRTMCSTLLGTVLPLPT